MNLKYTVLMSVYKKEEAGCLDIAIQSMVSQTVPPNEFIIVEDGPLNIELYNVIKKYTDKYKKLFKIISLPHNVGLGPALAVGIKESSNELIARMDSDDYSTPDRCEKQLKIFEQDPEMGIVGSYGTEFIEDINHPISVHRVPENNDEIRQFMRRRCAVLHPTVIYKKNDVLKSGNYRSVKLYEDYDLFSRMIFDQNIKAHNIPESLYFIRTSPDFFMRRGGVEYAKTVVKFKYSLYQKGYMKLSDFIVSGLGQAFVCILPNSIRKNFYMIFLRK